MPTFRFAPILCPLLAGIVATQATAAGNALAYAEFDWSTLTITGDYVLSEPLGEGWANVDLTNGMDPPLYDAWSDADPFQWTTGNAFVEDWNASNAHSYADDLVLGADAAANAADALPGYATADATTMRSALLTPLSPGLIEVSIDYLVGIDVLTEYLDDAAGATADLGMGLRYLGRADGMTELLFGDARDGDELSDLRSGTLSAQLFMDPADGESAVLEFNAMVSTYSESIIPEPATGLLVLCGALTLRRRPC